MATPTIVVAYLALFATVGFVFLFVNLLVGKLVRPSLPNEEKLEVYECGEPVIGSSFVQFDLRFYVVALLFIIFDVEVAFFFPWATVYGKAAQLAAPSSAIVAADVDPNHSPDEFSLAALARLHELGIRSPAMPTLSEEDAIAEGVSSIPAAQSKTAVQLTAKKLLRTSLADIGVFFAVLMVGFAYVWKRGDLDWVRSVAAERRERPPGVTPSPRLEPSASILSA